MTPASPPADDAGPDLVDESTRQKAATLASGEALEKFVSLDFPTHVTLSMVEDVCVLKCRMCPQSLDEYRSMYKGRYMSRDLLEKISAQIPDRKGLHVEMTGHGDPLQHPELESFVKRLRDDHPDLYIMVPTEGALLNEKRMRALLESGVSHISYSLNAHNRKTYEWLCGRDLYDRVRANLRRLIELREEMAGEKPLITTHIIGIKENEPDFQSFLDEWRPLLPGGVTIRTFGNWAGIVDGQVTPLDNWQSVDWENRYPCLNPFHYLKLNSQGQYLLCFLDLFCSDPPLGEIGELTLEEAWRGPYAEHRARHMQGKFLDRLCSQCMVWSLYPDVFRKKGTQFIIPTLEG